jgi:hypothetical protein
MLIFILHFSTQIPSLDSIKQKIGGVGSGATFPGELATILDGSIDNNGRARPHQFFPTCAVHEASQLSLWILVERENTLFHLRAENSRILP